MAPVYTYMVHDLRSNEPLGELPLRNVTYGFKLNDAGEATGQFQVESRNARKRMVRDPHYLTAPCRRALYIYRDDRPMWGGIIWTRRYDSRSRTVQIGAADWWSYFNHRRVLPILAADPGVEHVAQQQIQFDNTDQNEIARQLVAKAQDHTGGHIGIELDSSESGILRDRTYKGHQLKEVGSALSDLAGVTDGPDMMFGVGTALDQDGRPRRVLQIGEPWLGQQGSPHVWEYGGNLVSYVWPSDGTGYASRAFATADGAAEGVDIAVAEDEARYDLGYPLMELEEAYDGVVNEGTLQDHADEDQRAARRPVVLPELTVRGDRSPRVGEWRVGDDAVVAIEDDFLPEGVETTMRIVEGQISPQSDYERVDLVMAPLLDDID